MALDLHATNYWFLLTLTFYLILQISSVFEDSPRPCSIQSWSENQVEYLALRLFATRATREIFVSVEAAVWRVPDKGQLPIINPMRSWWRCFARAEWWSWYLVAQDAYEALFQAMESNKPLGTVYGMVTSGRICIEQIPSEPRFMKKDFFCTT